MQTQLMRASDDKVIGGVCGGLAHYFNIDPVLVRLGFVFLTFGSGIGLLVYAALWLVMPLAGQPGMLNQVFHSAQQVGQQVSQQVGQTVSNVMQTPAQPRFDPQTGQPLAQPMANTSNRNRNLGLVLLGVGALMLASFLHISGPFMALVMLGTGFYLLRRN